MIRFKLYQEMMEEYIANKRSGSFPLHSYFAFQSPETFYPGLDTRLLHDKSRFDWVSRLEAECPHMVAELDDLLQERVGFLPIYEKQTKQGKWAGCFFGFFGRRISEIYERCPKTAKLLDSIPGAIESGTSLFSALAPNTRVAPHCGNTNFKLRCQLPLRVPDGCGFKLADQDVKVTEGECFIFDDSFLHTVWNLSDKPRFALIFDIYHPDLTTAEIDALARLTLESDPHKYYFDLINSGHTADWVYEH